MQEIESNVNTGLLKISDIFDTNDTPYLNYIGASYSISFLELENIKCLKKFEYKETGVTKTRTLTCEYRISRDNISWTNWLELKENIDNFPIIDTKDKLYLDIKWIRNGKLSNGVIRILEYTITGEVEREVADGTSVMNIKPGEEIIFKAPYIYKVFKIEDIEVISSSDIDIKYRYSQDNSRTWSNWEFFTKENITTTRINPIRFFQIEYQISNNTNANISVQDINLIGDFQNLSKDYFKTNLFGIRECCQSNALGSYDKDGNFIPADNMSGSNCSSSNSLYEMTSQDKSNLFSPYKQNTAVDLLNKLSADTEQVFGHNVIYFVTDPDAKGQDHTLHEYQLYNVACNANIMASVEGNNFPDSQIVMNQFDLSLFESMTVNITKKQFKEAFGPQRRPSKEDFLYFCEVNRMYQVDHAQQFRGFNNSAVYYKLILKKYSQKSNVSIVGSDVELSDKFKTLTKNSTIDELFGFENNQDKNSIANKPQTKTLSIDPIRLEYSASIDKELIENGSTIISKSNYDLYSVDQGAVAVKYQNFNNILNVSDNIGYQMWFNINNYIVGETYSFINFYDDTNNLGINIDLINDAIYTNLNADTYTYSITGITGSCTALDEEVWYCYVSNIDQRNRKLNQYIYKRNVEDEADAGSLISTKLLLVYENEIDITPIEFELEDVNLQILGSDMKVTNIRMFTDIIPVDTHNKILNQYIIGNDSKYLVFADNANSRISLPKFPLN